jgi:hypothetical protein
MTEVPGKCNSWEEGLVHATESEYGGEKSLMGKKTGLNLEMQTEVL